MSHNYERAKKLYRRMIKDGWRPDAAKNEACISIPYLTLKEQEKIWKLKG